MIQPRPILAGDFMQMRWKVIAILVALGFSATAILSWQPAKAAPQAAAPAKVVTTAGAEPSGAMSIPTTTLAINSPAPMAERVVHYEIDAKYDARKHTIDATEVLTYHNLTGQALDHFPFHLYQN